MSNDNEPGELGDLHSEATVVDQSAPAGRTESQEFNSGDTRPALLLAEFSTPDSCIQAAATLRDEGFSKWDVHTPYPVHGMDDAMGLPPTKLGFISFGAGLTGVLSAVLMIQWMNGVDYPLIVGGKPPGAIPSMIPIMFELMVLLTGFATVFGMLGINRLPRHNHPIFESERFELCSDDRFFISIDTTDPNFDESRTPKILESHDAAYLEWVRSEGEGHV